MATEITVILPDAASRRRIATRVMGLLLVAVA